MKTGQRAFRNIVNILALISVPMAWLYAADLKPEDIVARHLDSIGTSAARAASKTRVLQGPAEFKILVGSGGTGVAGKSGLVSEGRKSVLMVKLSNGDYRGEQFVTDGDKVYIAATRADHLRSAFGEFVHSQDEIVREGLIGGTLTTAWALLNLDANHPKLTYNGEKKIDGVEAYEIGYHSRRKDDLVIHLYFDKDTYRHVMTTYTLNLVSGMAPGANGADVTQSVKQKETRYTIEEKFSDFRSAEGLTLPAKYVIHFTQELQDSTTEVFEWDIATDEFSNNLTLDPRNFQIK